MENLHLHVSNWNSKVPFPCIDLPPILTCRKNAPCAKLCYGCKGNFRFQNVKEPRYANLTLWNADPEQFEVEAIAAIFSHRYARFHATGDIPSEPYLAMLCRVARKCRNTKILVFTKQYEIVNHYIASGNRIPSNLRIVLSAWGDWLPENPHNFPMAYVRLKDVECHIPEKAVECTGYCGTCVMGKSCWSLKKGESVVFKQH